MSGATAWREVLAFENGGALQANVLMHIRDAVGEGGYVSRGRITSGLKEAYRPLEIEDASLVAAIDEAIGLLMRSGDIDELSTGAGRGYAPTPPRRLVWGGADDVVLGGPLPSSDATVRRGDEALLSGMIDVPLLRELGRPAWREALVQLGGGDEPNGDARALALHAEALTRSGERFSLDEPSKLAVLSGSGRFYGAPDGPGGRWARASGQGFFPAIWESGFTKRRILLAIVDGEASMWEPPSIDIWSWIVVGFTLARSEPVFAYDPATETLDFMTPPPRQVERAAMLTGEQRSAWSWRIDPTAQAIIAGLL